MKYRLAYISANRIGHQALEAIQHASWAKKHGFHIIILLSPNVVSKAFTYLESDNASFLPIPKLIFYPLNFFTKPIRKIFLRHKQSQGFNSDSLGTVIFFLVRLFGIESGAFEQYPSREYVNFLSITENLPSFQISPKILLTCRSTAAKIGIPENSKIACLHIRDSQYLTDPYRTWRNTDIKDYFMAIQYLNSNGYTVIRMGTHPLDKPNTNSSDDYIDYAASSYQSPLMDLYLLKNCDMFIGTSSGLATLANMISSNIVITNAYPLSFNTWGNNSVTLFKKIFDENSDNYISIDDMISSKNFFFYNTDLKYKDEGLAIISNTPEEILETIKYAENMFSHKQSDQFSEFEKKCADKLVQLHKFVNNDILSMFNLYDRIHLDKYSNSKVFPF